MKKYSHICLGGTFDHLHLGHKRIIDFAFHLGKKVTIGITSQELVGKKDYSDQIESFHVRKEGVLRYLEQRKYVNNAKIEQLEDIYGSATDDASLSAIIVTEDTIKNAKKINEKRKLNHLEALEVFSVPFMKGPDNKIISSQRIRAGLINRKGEDYIKPFTTNRQLNLPPRLRELLRKPLGIIVEGDERFASFTAEKAIKVIERNNPCMTIFVGDIVNRSIKGAGYKPKISIIDLKSRRKQLKFGKSKSDATTYSNPPGVIRQEAVKQLKKLIDSTTPKRTKTLIIKGEEDLLALPAILLAPLNSMVVYGQINMGIILVKVTEEKKEQVAGIIRQFE